MRFLLAIAVVMTPTLSTADDLTGKDWALAAIDGNAYPARATLRIEADGTIAGRAPCNRWGGTNRAELPKLDLGAIRATRMACRQLEEEQAFFAALAAMTEARVDATGRLVLMGRDGRTMTFVTGPAD